MSGALKKIKLEVGDDSLVYAMAKSDTIPQLEKFRGHCKPTYLFMASGKGCESIWNETHMFPFRRACSCDARSERSPDEDHGVTTDGAREEGPGWGGETSDLGTWQ